MQGETKNPGPEDQALSQPPFHHSNTTKDCCLVLTLEELKSKPEILQHIDWELTPQEAFQAYQVKSVDSWKHRNLPEVFHFYLDLWKGEAKVFLMRRSLKSAEDVAEIPVPPEMVASCLEQHVEERKVSGQYPIDDAIRDWIRSQLGQ